MAPSKSSRNHHDDPKADAHHAKEKNGNGHSSTKMRRGASHTGNSHLREVTSAPTSAPVQSAVDPTPPGLHWSSFERETLHAYRREHRLNTPSSFRSPYHQWVLSQAGGIGIYSPTMVRRRQARRQSKNHLALTVRKHFNGLGVQENDVIVDLIHKLRHDTKPEPKKLALAVAPAYNRMTRPY